MTDTLAIFRRITRAGMPEEQAEILARELCRLPQPLTSAADARKPSRAFGKAVTTWYLSNLSNHPLLNGIGTGLALAAIEWTVFSPYLRSLARLCSY
jgi:hypothetical protein